MEVTKKELEFLKKNYPASMSNPTNEERAEIGRRALVMIEFDVVPLEDLSASIVDLVTNLLHLAHQNDIEPDYVIHTATMHFDAEVEEEAGL